ncbi:hypothetical protein MTR_6g016435 [Medicago truncatula]|uniref:Uncharacterized protein n=1 Tax=Medicago truncatula TaxID=3880 RepID=A0A072U7V5_MEDTR|nr:hypothetical protein MTR_6g016435 [Medicago truncatula]
MALALSAFCEILGASQHHQRGNSKGLLEGKPPSSISTIQDPTSIIDTNRK